MIANQELDMIAGKTMTGKDGAKIGKIVDVYESTDNASPTFVTVSTGMFGGAASFVPLDKATLEGESVVVPYDKDLVKQAPRVTADQELSSPEEDQLYQHYGLTAAPATGTVGQDTSGPTTDEAMTRSEEQMRVGTQQSESGRVRLRKRVVTETQTQTVPVSHDEVTVSREPITEANRGKAMDGPAISEEEHEITLTEEQPVVTTEAVPVERVRMGKDKVTEQESVSGEVRKEQIDLDQSEAKAGQRR